jgi:antitoxin CcdA
MVNFMPRIPQPSKNLRKPVNLSLRQDIVDQAKELGINVSQVAEAALSDEVRRMQETQWLAQNAAAIKEHNERVDSKGMYNEGLRRF